MPSWYWNFHVMMLNCTNRLRMLPMHFTWMRSPIGSSPGGAVAFFTNSLNFFSSCSFSGSHSSFVATASSPERFLMIFSIALIRAPSVSWNWRFEVISFGNDLDQMEITASSVGGINVSSCCKQGTKKLSHMSPMCFLPCAHWNCPLVKSSSTAFINLTKGNIHHYRSARTIRQVLEHIMEVDQQPEQLYDQIGLALKINQIPTRDWYPLYRAKRTNRNFTSSSAAFFIQLPKDFINLQNRDEYNIMSTEISTMGC